MSTVIEVVSPLDVAAATRLDKRIRLMASTVRENLAKIAELVDEAKAGQVHVALGFASWTAYLSDALGGQLELGTEDRRAVVELLAGGGMSNRAIAAAVGVTEGTVRNDKVRSDYAPEPVTGLDGKTYAKKPKKKPVPQPAPQPAAVVENTSEQSEEEEWDDDDLRQWVLETYRHANEQKRYSQTAVTVFAAWIGSCVEKNPTCDIFSATWTRWDSLILCVHMAQWIEEEDDSTDAVEVAQTLLQSLQDWWQHLREQLKKSADQTAVGA